MFFDIAAVLGGMQLAHLLLPLHSNFPLGSVLSFPLFYWFIFLVGSLYDGRRNLRILDESASFLGLSFFAVISLAGVIYLFKLNTARTLFFTFVSLTALFQLLLRAGIRVYWQVSRKYGSPDGNGTRRALIVGAGSQGRRVQSEIEKLGIHAATTFCGFVDDHPEKLSNLKVVGKVKQTPELVLQKNITDVIITLPISAYHLRDELLQSLQPIPVHVWVISDLPRLAVNPPDFETFAGIPMLDVRGPAMNDYQRLAKRVFDLILASLMLFFGWPLMLLIAFLIRRDSPGPALFRQARIGEGGKPFEMVKFRTMVQDAEVLRHLVEREDENGNLIHKTADDPRVTKLGKFLRRSSLDELPNLFNVLKGEMSLVGPRPELPYIVEKYQPWQHARHTVPPGLTGWWQINGRSDKPMHLHTEDDLYYIRNYSLWLDVQILLKTALAVLLRKGAF